MNRGWNWGSFVKGMFLGITFYFLVFWLLGCAPQTKIGIPVVVENGIQTDGPEFVSPKGTCIWVCDDDNHCKCYVDPRLEGK